MFIIPVKPEESRSGLCDVVDIPSYVSYNSFGICRNLQFEEKKFMRAKNCTVSKEPTTKFQAPTTPGWQILLEAAQAVVREGATKRDVALLSCNLIARKDEHIPTNRRMEIVHEILVVATKIFKAYWTPDFVEFLLAQLGEEGVRKSLADSDFELRNCTHQCDGCDSYLVRYKSHSTRQERWPMIKGFIGDAAIVRID